MMATDHRRVRSSTGSSVQPEGFHAEFVIAVGSHQVVTSAPDASLMVRTARSAGWVIAWRMLTRSLGLVSTVVLTKLLLPSDFGLVALATSFALAVDGLSELGVGEALMRETSLDRDMYNTGFTISFCRGLLTAAVIAIGAWPVAVFFERPSAGHHHVGIGSGDAAEFGRKYRHRRFPPRSRISEGTPALYRAAHPGYRGVNHLRGDIRELLGADRWHPDDAHDPLRLVVCHASISTSPYAATLAATRRVLVLDLGQYHRRSDP